MQAQRILEVPEERIQAIEPSRRPGASPYFKPTIRSEQQGLTRRDRERPSSRFPQQEPVTWFSNAHATGEVHAGPDVNDLPLAAVYWTWVAKGSRRLPICQRSICDATHAAHVDSLAACWQRSSISNCRRCPRFRIFPVPTRECWWLALEHVSFPLRILFRAPFPSVSYAPFPFFAYELVSEFPVWPLVLLRLDYHNA